MLNVAVALKIKCSNDCSHFPGVSVQRTVVNLDRPPSDLPIPSGASMVQYSTVFPLDFCFFVVAGASPSDAWI